MSQFNKLKEALAKYEHDRWREWMTYFLSRSVILNYSDGIDRVAFSLRKDDFQRWKRQMKTAYQDLPENEKESDRARAKKIIELLKKLEEI